jgi:hypothetical protein
MDAVPPFEGLNFIAPLFTLVTIVFAGRDGSRTGSLFGGFTNDGTAPRAAGPS